MKKPTHLDVSAATHVGRVRQSNQDCVLVGNWCGIGPDESHFEAYSFNEPMFTCMVADGIGGHNSGEVASQLAINPMKDQLDNAVGSAEIQSAVEATARAVFEQSLRRPDLNRMGTTIVGAQFMQDRSVSIFNVGDSRAYLFRNDALRQLSIDDTTIDFKGHKSGHVLTQAIGGSDPHRIPRVHVKNIQPVRAGETLLLCSDGLYNMVTADNIMTELRNQTKFAAPNLVRLAVENGGSDNVTAIVANFV